MFQPPTPYGGRKAHNAGINSSKKNRFFMGLAFYANILLLFFCLSLQLPNLKHETMARYVGIRHGWEACTLYSNTMVKAAVPFQMMILH